MSSTFQLTNVRVIVKGNHITDEDIESQKEHIVNELMKDDSRITMSSISGGVFIFAFKQTEKDKFKITVWICENTTEAIYELPKAEIFN